MNNRKQKQTRAFKMGYTDGLVSGKAKNTFTEGSTRFKDYQAGFKTGIDMRKLEAVL